MRVPSTKIQNNFGKYLKYVEAGEDIIVTKSGKDAAQIALCYDKDYVKEEQSAYRSSDGRVTYKEFLELMEESEQRYELIDGVIYNLASPSYKHQRVVGELYGAFHNWFKRKKCVPLTSPFDVTFFKEEDNICVVQPDIVIICDKDNLDEKDNYKGTPTLVVEVLSPSTRSKDMLKKLELYKQCGVNEYWIVDPINEHILVYTLENNDIVNNKTYSKNAHQSVSSELFEELEADLQDVFT
ncbi:type II toxin-antitoxin system prevent-host-death family antitoxin [Virgibacillus sp. NKC19-3]|uniref:type II toxin-antitoxin system prevent-host-death family antitoxin n=1 Tax=Virgibacillus saliphilus TaxID=2831674 RepID=UPI001C9B4AB9|nr:type II toxin-antitoxin system prevent-host-death family antitoxin [Virgibacillus sp. NKC19-3]MBY7144339.1 type II toxin-antitoxin system prevent-host-death family antitoxin [Virgibacillus sp. NKC19-3]